MQNRLNTIKGARGGRERDGRTEMIVDVGRRTHHSEGKWGAWRTFSRGGSNALMKSQGRAIHGTGRGAEGHGKKKRKKNTHRFIWPLESSHSCSRKHGATVTVLCWRHCIFHVLMNS